jgi:hypothetical protein
MKNLFFIILMSVMLFSCEQDDNSQNNSSGNTNISQQDLNGNWRITYFAEDGKDETFYFSGYTFTFSNNVVAATKGGTVVNGVYSLSGSSSSSGSISGSKFILTFPETDPWEELNEDWDILEKSANKIKLKHISGGNGGTDDLVFEKN